MPLRTTGGLVRDTTAAHVLVQGAVNVYPWS